MWVFVRRIDPTTTRKELERFFNKGLKPGWAFFPFPTHGAIKRCEILCITDKDNRSVEYHGLVEIMPAKAAVSAIQRLNGSLLKGKSVEVRKYSRRSSYRDRRDHFSDLEPASEERRKRDRRRPNLHSRILHASSTQGMAAINRMHL